MSYRLQCRVYTRQSVNQAVNYLNVGTIPAGETNVPRFKRRWAAFRLQDGELYFGTRRVIPVEDVPTVLREEYERAGDIGRDRFYSYLRGKYVGISEQRVMDFLRGSETHQLHVRPHRERTVW